MKKDKRIFGKILMTLLILFFYLPILYMIIFSFNEGKSLTSFTGFSLRWYEHMLKSRDMMSALYTTFSVALLATLISTVAGTIAAIGLSKSKRIVRDLMEQVDNLPIMNPEIVTAIGFMLLFITFKVDKGYMTMLLAHIAFCIPYVILSVMPKVRSLDPNLADAALDLGATPFQALTKVIVPQIAPGILSGALIAFTMSVDDFIISYFVTGGGVKNLSIMVYTMSKRVNPSINAVSTLVVVIITIALVLINVVPGMIAKREQSEKRHHSFWIPASIGIGVVTACLLFVLFGVRKDTSEHPFSGEELYIYLPGEYINEEVVESFEEATGATVIMENFDSNEQMYIKVANGESFDILIPSDYMIERLIVEGYLQELDKSKLTCMEALDPAVLRQDYDYENTYSVPYFWGTVGIVYDKTKVPLEDLEEQGFGIFLDTKYKGDIYLYDSERDSFMMALKNLGYSMNTSSEQELMEAYEWLVGCVSTMSPEIVTDEIIDNMAQARKALGLVYSGDATYIVSENEEVGFYLPEEGTNRWYDSMVIPKNAQNTELAYAFMNYFSEYQNSYDNSSYVGYTSPNLQAKEDMYAPGGDYEGIEAYIPRMDNEKDEIFHFNMETKKLIGNLWSKVKIAASNAE